MQLENHDSSLIQCLFNSLNFELRQALKCNFPATKMSFAKGCANFYNSNLGNLSHYHCPQMII